MQTNDIVIQQGRQINDVIFWDTFGGFIWCVGSSFLFDVVQKTCVKNEIPV